MRVHFGRFTFDGERRQLLDGSNAVALSPKAFRLLELLLANRPRALSKEELQERVWPDTFVSEANLSILVSEIRHAVGDDARSPTFVRTVYGFGYAFGGEASGDEPRRPPSGFVHRLLFKDREIELVEGENVLGRDPDLAVAIRDASVSRRHARILVAGASVRVEDLKSKNGTFVGGERVVDGALLTDGDELRVGSVTLAFASQPVEGSTKTTAESG